jgi:hypothetical protein
LLENEMYNIEKLIKDLLKYGWYSAFVRFAHDIWFPAKSRKHEVTLNRRVFLTHPMILATLSSNIGPYRHLSEK